MPKSNCTPPKMQSFRDLAEELKEHNLKHEMPYVVPFRPAQFNGSVGQFFDQQSWGAPPDTPTGGGVGGQLPQMSTNSGGVGFFSRIFLPMGEIFHKAEAAMGTPLYTWFSRIERARDNLDVKMLPWQETIGKMARGLPRLSQRGGKNRSWGFDNKQEREDVQVLFEAIVQSKYFDPGSRPLVSADEVAEMRKTYGPVISKTADELEQFYKDFFTQGERGYSEADVHKFFAGFPEIRRRGGAVDLAADQHNRVAMLNRPGKITAEDPRTRDSIQGSLKLHRSKIGRDMYEDFRKGDILLTDREYDFAQIASGIVRKKVEMEELAPTWNAARQQVSELAQEGQIPRDMYDLWMKFTSTVRNIPDGTAISLARTMSNINDKVFRLTKGKLGTSDDTTFLNVSQALLSVNYMANMGFNPGVALRNYIQPFLTSFPIVGNDLLYGLRMAANMEQQVAYRGKMIPLSEALYKQGVITRTTTPMQAKEMERTMIGLSGDAPSTTALSKVMEKYKTSGWWMFRKAENFNRAASFLAMQKKSLRAAKKYMGSNRSLKDKEAFMYDSGLEIMVPNNSPMTKQIFDTLDTVSKKASDDVLRQEEVALTLGIEHVKQSQFQYRAGNSAPMLQSTAGRFLGQYGTWPSWYVAHTLRMMKNGSGKGRMMALGRFVGVNALMLKGIEEVVGADVSNWVFLSPLSYQGGPFLQAGPDLMAKAQVELDEHLPTISRLVGAGPVTDPVTRIKAARATNLYKQFLPIPQGAYPEEILDDWEVFQNQGIREGLVNVLRFPTTDDIRRLR
mgnify:CR=1 FL=1